MNNEGKIISAQPVGCQFDDAFMKQTYDSESSNAAPHPFAVEVGEGFTMIGLFSGKSQPFIILPNHVVGLISDTNEDQETIKKNLRKLTNNILIVLRENKDQLNSYMERLWAKVSEKKWDAIPLEKPKATETDLIRVQKNHSTPPPLNATSQDDYQDIISLHNQTIGTKQEDVFSNDNISKKPKSVNIFGRSTTADPFGGSVHKLSPSSITDPFGSSTPSPAPVSKGTDLKYKPELFGVIKTKSSVSTDEFSDNPFASENSESVSKNGVDLNSDNQFEENKKKKIEKMVDPFTDDPFR